MKVSQRQMWELNSLLQLDMRHGSSYSLSGVGIIGYTGGDQGDMTMWM